MTEVWGFSLFIHGVAFLHKSELSRLPHWLRYTAREDDDDDYAIDNRESQAGNRVTERAPLRQPGRIDVIYKGPASRIAHEREVSMRVRTPCHFLASPPVL